MPTSANIADPDFWEDELFKDLWDDAMMDEVCDYLRHDRNCVLPEDVIAAMPVFRKHA